MGLLKTLIFLTIFFAVSVQSTISETPRGPNSSNPKNKTSEDKPTSLRGSSRTLSSYHHGNHHRYGHLTCDVYPKICRAKWSPGKHCCFKRCVNLKSDRNNCGRCGRRCRYWETCCKGKCVNLMFDRKHCGSCHNKCKSGTWCVYGMCNYA